jgi:hypothetical protein
MKKWLATILLLIVTTLTAYKAEGQTVTQTYIDPCDQKVYVVVIPFGQNQTVAVIRGKSKIVTLADISSGVFQTWVNSVFATPCPQNDAIRLAQEAAARAAADAAARAAGDAAAKAAADAAAKAASDAAAKAAASAASGAASNAASSAASGAASNAASGAASNAASSAASGAASSAAGNAAGGAASSAAASAAAPPPVNVPPPPPTSTPPPAAAPPPASSSSSPPPASGGSSSTEAKPAEAKPAESKPAETKSDKPAEQKQEEKKTETKQEEKKEESKTEEKKSEEKKTEEKKEEKKSEEKKKDEEKKKEEEKKKKEEEKKKKQEVTNPTLLASDITAAEASAGKYLASISLGLSKSSLAGDVSYSAGLVVNSNLSSIVMTGGITKMGLTADGQLDAIHSYGTAFAYLSGNYMNLLGYTYIKPTPKKGTYGYNVGVINLFLKNDAGGFDYNMASSAIVFWTKPYQYSKKLTISPQVFTMFAPISYNSVTGVTTVNRHMGFLLGAAFDYKISKRFGFSFNYKMSGNTKPYSAFLSNMQIGSRMVL